MTSFRWGILGTGNIAGSMAAALKLVPGAELRAVASRRQDTADAFAAQWRVPTAHGSYDALLSDSDIEIVYIATPNALHRSGILEALAAGKHVLCEKPLTMSADHSRLCAEAARAADLFLMEAMWSAFFPAMRKAVDLVQDGAIGTPRHLTANFVSYRDPGTFPNLFDPLLGGGAGLDLGIYPIAAALLLAGPVEGGSAQTVIGETGVDEMVAMALRHDTGVLSQLSFGFRVEMPIEVRLVGDKGRLDIPRDFHKARTLLVTTDEEERRIELPPIGEGYAHEAIAVQRCLSEGLRECPDWPLSNTIACAELVNLVAR